MVKAENKGKSTPKKNSAKIVATNFKVGQKVICLTHPGNIKYGTYGWEEQPIIDEIIGLPKNEKDDLFYTKESPRGIHESRVHLFDPKRIIKIQDSYFISKWPVIMMPHKGLYNFQWQDNLDNSRQDFAFPIAADLDYITWELLGLGFQIIHTKLMSKPHKKEFLELVEPVEVVEATNPPKKNVATKKIASHHIICDFCGKQNYPDHKNPHLFWGFRDADTGMFIGEDCKKEFYKAKHAGKYGKENIGLYSELLEPVPQDPLKHDSKLSKDGLEKLLPAKGKKKGLKELLEKPKAQITGLNGCNCHPFSSWEESDKYHNQKFNIGDTVQNRCKKKVGQVIRLEAQKGYVVVKYGPNFNDNHLEHVAMLNLVKKHNAKIDGIVATKKAMPVKPPKSPGDPRTEMMKFRLSHHTRNILTTLATELDLSCADIIHLGIRSMARTAKTKYTEEQLNQIIEL